MSLLIETELRDGDLQLLAETLRPLDRAEVEAFGYSALHGLQLSVKASEWVSVGRTPDGTPACIFGLGDLGDDSGSPWMLGTDAIREARRSFVGHSRRIVARMQEERRVLINMTDSRNTTSHRWLEALGFSIHRALPVPAPSGATFFTFSRIRTNVR